MNTQLSILQFFQGIRSPMLNIIFLIFTISTELPVIVAFTGYIYWCINKNIGQRILFALIGNITLNTGIKEFVKAPRPIGIEGINSMRVSTATGYSFPSGHTQTATSFWMSLIVIFKKSWVTILGTIMFLGVGISRLYLAVHWPIDVICGWIFGIIFTLLFCKVFDYVSKTKKYYFLILTLVPFIIGIVLIDSQEYTKIVGLLTGYIIGYIVEDKYIKFNTEYKIKSKIKFSKNNYYNRHKLKRNIGRFTIGIVTLGCLYIGLKYMMPDEIIFNYIRYTMVVFYAMAGVPIIFKILKLN